MTTRTPRQWLTVLALLTALPSATQAAIVTLDFTVSGQLHHNGAAVPDDPTTGQVRVSFDTNSALLRKVTSQTGNRYSLDAPNLRSDYAVGAAQWDGL